MVETPVIWQSLVEVSKFGGLVWKSTGSELFYGTRDPRSLPSRYIVMSGEQRFWDSGQKNKFDPPKDLLTQGNGRFESPAGVITGTIGLLKLQKVFKFEPNNPSRVLLVGAITDKSLMCTLEWVKSNNWKANIVLTELSEIPIRHIEILRELAFFEGSPEFELEQADFTSQHNKADIIVADIVNLWAVPAYALDGTDPYANFTNVVKKASNLLTKRGIFYSRCVVYPEYNEKADLNVRHTRKDHASFIARQIGDLVGTVQYESLEKETDNLFDKAYPASYCGLGSVSRHFVEHPTLQGMPAEKLIVGIHKSTFREVDTIRIVDLKSGAIYLNFACRN